MSVGDLIDSGYDSLTEDNMDCEKSYVGSLPRAQRRYAEHAPLGLFTTRDEPPANLIVTCEAERNPTSGMLVPSENPSMAGANFKTVRYAIRPTVIRPIHHDRCLSILFFRALSALYKRRPLSK